MTEICFVQDQVPDINDDIIHEVNTPAEKGLATTAEHSSDTSVTMQDLSKLPISKSSARSNLSQAHLNQTSMTIMSSPVTMPPNQPGRDHISKSSVRPLQNPESITTQLGKAAQIVLGSTDDVRKLDVARMHLKGSPRCKKNIDDYKNKLAVIQTQVLAQDSNLKKTLKDWEKQFFLDHDCRMATLQEMKEDTVASNL